MVVPSPFLCFWEKHPALLLGIILLLGTAFSFHCDPIELFTFFVLLIPFAKQPRQWKKMVFFLLVFALGWGSACYRAPLIQLNHPKMEGNARFTISSIKNYQSPFHRSLAYKGKLHGFHSQDKNLFTPIPCQIYLPFSTNRPKANCDYEINGTLVQKGPRQFVFKPKKNRPWTPIPSTSSLAEIRYKAKLAVHDYLKEHIKDRSASTFLNALATGDVDERTLSMEFSRLGIQHILAISGFHFALIVLFLSILFNLFLSPRISSSLLILLLSAYYLFLGDSPSVQRAWIAMSAFLVGKLFNLRISALNALGLGLCFEVLIEPAVISHLGFILSFLCTLSILLLYPLMQPICKLLLPSRTFSTAKSMPHLDQWGYVIAAFIRNALAVNIAVHLACLPVLLFLFHRFPLLSLVYNLFFPFWVSISLLLLCAALLFAFPIPPLGQFLFAINEHWTSFALTITSHPPALIDFVIRSKSLTYGSVVLFLSALFMAAIYFTECKESLPIARWRFMLKKLWKQAQSSKSL
ncbi:MAG: ComEC/Rec2 family competence protein [Verrucomicrobia bacterium]|nr:ComEC/Rec2 family competence protein [Verrucomicrobiota bacterium]